MPKRFMRFPLREGLDLPDSIGTTCATISAVAEETGGGAGTAMCSGTFLLRGLTVVLVVVVVLDNGRDGERVVGRDGPATFPSPSCSRLEWRACTRREAV